ncbi:MAG: hypothetical protein CL910_05580 [Deltaproteobacteria bacterium]|nr:hypothetical protein [Deltaproteobacteria bacterium]
MPDLLLVAGLAWWFGGTYFGARHRFRESGPGALFGSASTALLHIVGIVASVSMVALALTASARIANTEGDFGLFVFGAILSAILAGSTLGAAQA